MAQYQVFLTLLVALIIRGNLLPGSLWAMGLDAALIIVTMITPAVSFVLHFKLPDGVAVVLNKGNEYWVRLVPVAAPVYGGYVEGGRNGAEVGEEEGIGFGMTGRRDSDSDTIPPESYDIHPHTF